MKEVTIEIGEKDIEDLKTIFKGYTGLRTSL